MRPRARVHLSDSFAEQRLITKRMPIASETILPRNYGRGPGSIQFNMRASKTIGFGKVKATANSPERPRYGLVCTLQMRNLLNHNNPGPIIGNIASPLFGKANQPLRIAGLSFSCASRFESIALGATGKVCGSKSIGLRIRNGRSPGHGGRYSVA